MRDDTIGFAYGAQPRLGGKAERQRETKRNCLTMGLISLFNRGPPVSRTASFLWLLAG